MNVEAVRKLVRARQSPGFFFVNIGANDGVENDPIHPFLEEYGWAGVAVEPDPDVFATLQANYRKFPGVALERALIRIQVARKYRGVPADSR